MGIQWTLVAGGLLVGTVVGLTGMGGGALMTPMLVFLFKIDTLTAISSDIVVSLFMKPAGAAVHLKRRTVNLKLVLWLCLGSVPAAFCGVFLIRALPHQEELDAFLRKLLGLALLLAALGLVVRAVLQMLRLRTALGEGPTVVAKPPEVVVRRVPTVILGALAGLLVGMTSVGAGSVIIVILLLMHPALRASELVGTDLVQAVPLVGAAAASHLLYGDFSLGLAVSLLIGAIPGAFLGAQISSRAPGGIIRRALALLLLSTGLKLLGLPTGWVLASALTAFVLGNILWMFVRRRLLQLPTPETSDADLPG
jgi:uncharacterized membrane protein YfcA